MNKPAPLVDKKKRNIGFLLIGLLALIGIVLLILPADYFDTGHATCVSVLLLNRECPGCGMTRAVQHLIHFEFKEAFEFNKLSFVVFPLLVYMLLWEIRKRYFIKNGHTEDQTEG